MSMRSLCGVALVAAVGCGFSPPGDLACSDLAEVRCARQVSCSNGSILSRIYGDLATCQTRLADSCNADRMAPSTGETPSKIESCVIAYGDISCADLFANNLPAACVFLGKRPMGAGCSFGVQCASGFCSGDKTSACGHCGPPPAAGASCLSSNCADGQTCVSRTSMCQEVPASGMPCDINSLPCGSDLYCAGNSDGAKGSCMPALQSGGAPCGGPLPGCDSQLGLSCGGITSARSCGADVYAGDGQPCGPLTDGTTAVCAAGGECYSPSGVALSGVIGTCKAAAADGQPCDAVFGPPCLTPARCIFSGDAGTSGVCVLVAAVDCD